MVLRKKIIVPITIKVTILIIKNNYVENDCYYEIKIKACSNK